MMSGMLVPVAPVDKAARAIETLFGVDPEFVTLCKTLYGSDVDPVEVWTDVFGKDEPSGPDMHVPGALQTKRGRKRALEAAGIGATLIGGGLGVKDIAEQTPKLSEAVGRAKIKPAVRLVGVGGMLVGDAAATANQIGNARSRRRSAAVVGTKAARDDTVAKISVGALADGLEAGMRKLPGLGGLAPKVRPAAAKVGNVGNDLKSGYRAARSGSGSLPADTPRGMRTAHAATRFGQEVRQGPGAALTRTKTRTAVAAGVAGAAAGSQLNKRYEEEDLDVVWAGEFEKFDEDKRLVFGWASVVEVNGSPVVDRQGDYIHPDDLENASYEYVIKSRVGGDMHTRNGAVPFKVSDLVESMVVTPEKLEKMGIPSSVAKSMPVGWWVGFKVHSDRHWEMVKKQARTGFSIHGRGKRIPMTMDQIMPGYH